MIDLVYSIGLAVLGALLIAVAVRVLLRERVNFHAFAGGMAALLFYWAVIVAGSETQRMIPLLAGLSWNWSGKVVTIAAVLLAIAVLPWVTREEAGLRLRLNPGSLVPALVCATLLCALSWGVEAWMNDGRDLSAERLLYQALMPGIDEELFFRGLLLALLLRAFDERWSFLGAPVGPAALVVTFIFAAGHGLGVADGQIRFDALPFCMTGALGFGLLWLRQRTGSVWPAILAHNLINVGNSFF